MRPLLPGPDGLTRVFVAPGPPPPLVTWVWSPEPGAREAFDRISAAASIPILRPTLVIDLDNPEPAQRGTWAQTPTGGVRPSQE